MLNDAGTRIGLLINCRKTKAMKNTSCEPGYTNIGDDSIDFVDKYVHLGREVTHDHKIDGEIRRRRAAAWTSFKGIQKRTQEDEQYTRIRAQLFNTNILPALNYGAETSTVRKAGQKKLATTQRAMKR